MRPLPLVFSSLFLLAAAGCHHEKQVVVSPTATNLAAASAPAPQAAKPAGPKSCKADLDCGDQQLCIRGQCVDISAGLAECQMVRVHFDFDSANIHQGDLSALQRVARCLKADQALHVRVEGNADERGTEEYNLALGDKRATSVAKYLETVGVSAAQLKTISYGKVKPLCVEHDEACWSQNRRAAVKPQLSEKKGKRKK
jgi:peptidoglycan-associated lipoprotein